MVHIFLAIMISIHIIALLFLMITNAYNDVGFAWLNPCFIYKHSKVNWFGAAFLALVANVAIPGIAIIYWFYKLCTVGRRQNNAN